MRKHFLGMVVACVAVLAILTALIPGGDDARVPLYPMEDTRW